MTLEPHRALICLIVLFLLGVSALGSPTSNQRVDSSSALPPLVLDAHIDCARRILERGDDLADESVGAQADIPKWRAGGIDIVWVSAWVDPRRYTGEQAYVRAVELIDAVRDQIHKHSDELELCQTAKDCRRAAARGKIAVLLGVEGGVVLNNNPEYVQELRKRGVRRLTLVWRGNLDWVGSSQEWDESPVARPRGLNSLGRSIVAELLRHGIVPDLSHASERTALDVLNMSSKPVIFSHSNARVLMDHPRNVSDEVLRRLKANGGVIGVNFYDKFLAPRRPRTLLSGARASISDVVAHIDHIRSVAGIDHIGIGSDWDGDIRPAKGLENASKLPALFEALRRHGYSEEDIRKIAGENFLRVLEQYDRIELSPTVPAKP